jgi:hypothetical protein
MAPYRRFRFTGPGTPNWLKDRKASGQMPEALWCGHGVGYNAVGSSTRND